MTTTGSEREDVAAAVVALLDRVSETGAPAEEIRRELAVLQAQLRRDHPDVRLDLASHPESFDGSASHDVIVRGAGRTLSIGVAGSPLLPWPLRGVVRPTDQVVLRVNGHVLTMGEAVHVLDGTFEEPRLLRELVHAAVISHACIEDPVEISDAELQQAADAFRRAKGLCDAEQTGQWLDEHGLTPERFAGLVERAAALAAFRRRAATAGRVEAAFARNRSDYARLTVAWAALPIDAGLPGDAGLWTDPMRAVLAAHAAGRDGAVCRWLARDLPPGASALAAAPVGEPVDVSLAGNTVLAVVLARAEASLDAETRLLVEQDVFTEWLEERRRTADVEWYWGAPARTRRLDADRADA